MTKKTVTGRNPGQPDLQSLPETPTQSLAREFVEKFRERYPDVAGVAKGSFRCKNPQLQQIPRSDMVNMVNMDYATIERRVAAMSPAFAAPYGQEGKTHD